MLSTLFRTGNGALKENECSKEDIDYATMTLFKEYQSRINFKPVAQSCTAALFYARKYLDATMEEK